MSNNMTSKASSTAIINNDVMWASDNSKNLSWHSAASVTSVTSATTTASASIPAVVAGNSNNPNHAALENLLVTLGNARRDFLLKSNFMDLLRALEHSAESAEALWQELLDFCHVEDASRDTLTKAELQGMYHGTAEYNPEGASANLITQLKAIFDSIDTSGDGLVSLEEFVAGEWREDFLRQQLSTGYFDTSLLDVDAETMAKVFDAADYDKDRVLDFFDFCAAVLKFDDSTLKMVKPHAKAKRASVVGAGGRRGSISAAAKVAAAAAARKSMFVGSLRHLNAAVLRRGVDKIMGLGREDFGQQWLAGLLEVYPEACALVNSSNHRDIETATDHAIKQVLEMLYEFIDTLEDTRTDCTNRDDGALDERLRLFAVKYVQMDTKPQYLEHLLDFMVDSVGHDGSVVEDDELQMWVDLYAFVQYAFMLAEDEVDDVAVNSFLKAARTPAKDFVDHLKDFCLNHKALSHDYLNGLVRGAFPDMGLVFCQLLDEYSHYGKDFVRHMRTLLDESKNEKHRQLLDEDLASEEGHLEDDDREYLQVIGIDPALIDGIPHRDLFQQMKKTVFETYNYDAGSMSSTSTAASPGRRFAEEVMRIVDTNSYEARAAALGVATECIVPVIYTYFIRALEHHTKLTPTDYAFFSLHVKADEKHGDTMASIVADLAATDEIRAEMFRAVGEMMDARCRLWDGLLSLAVSTKHSNSEIAPDDPERLYDDTSSRWVRNNPNCLSDFTARPFFFTFCKPHVTENSFVLDLGCGEGYCTRGLRDFGPRQIIGIDLSGKMIDLARQQESCNGRIHYVQGNATDTQAILRQHFLEFDLMSQDAVEGCFDLVTAVFLFNYMSIEEMGSVGTQVFSLLKPGGRFVFTVPHPALKYWDRRSKKAPFYLNKEDSKGYFEDRNHRTSGVIFTRDGQELKIQSVHKTFSDYFKFVCELGFVVEQVEELGVDAKMMEDDPTFFAGVEGVPLHVAFKVIKPDSDSDKALQEMKSSVHFNSEPPSEREEDDLLKNFGATASALSGFLVPPKEVLWNCMDYGDRFVLPMPQVVVDELVESACMCIKKGIDHTNYMPGDVWPLTHVKRFGQECANRLMRKHGNLIIRGFDVDALADTEPERERLAKLCYYILMTCTGNIDVTRGRLFDVKDRSLDVHQDNVLFSATSQECGWHSDGSSRDWFPDMVCLLCIRPALEGGEFQIANTCNAFYDLSMRLPKFLMHELTRPLCRDIIEKGASSGFGSEMLKDKPESFWTSFSRQPNILRQRVRLNNYPIYERNEKTRQTKFRHLDHWLESGHMKAGLRISPLLKIATAELDKALHRGCRFDRRLERGEIAMANNHLVAHRRNAFSDVKSSDHHGRLLVRCWMKVEK